VAHYCPIQIQTHCFSGDLAVAVAVLLCTCCLKSVRSHNRVIGFRAAGSRELLGERRKNYRIEVCNTIVYVG
jgi:hypothetical protein